MSETVLSCLTPPGAGAIATLALRGPAAWTLIRDLAQRELPMSPQPGKFWLTRLGNPAPGEADEVVVAVKQTEPVPWVELHCHGGQAVVRLLEDLFTARGVELCSWQQFAQDQKTDRLQAAAFVVLTEARTVRTASIALDQYHCAMAHVLEEACAALQRGETKSAARILGETLRFSAVGRHLNEPWRVVIAGAPNVGKSSLVNAIAGYQRSVVSSIPGTTRDVVTTQVALDGWPVEIADTAGWRHTEAALEREGIARAREAAVAADLCLWVLDASAPPVFPEQEFGPLKAVVNKIDLQPAWDLSAVTALPVSAKTGEGVPELCQSIANWLVPDPPSGGMAVPFTAALASALGDGLALAQSGKAGDALKVLEGIQGVN